MFKIVLDSKITDLASTFDRIPTKQIHSTQGIEVDLHRHVIDHIREHFLLIDRPHVTGGIPIDIPNGHCGKSSGRDRIQGGRRTARRKSSTIRIP